MSILLNELKIAIYIPRSLGGVRNVTSSLSDAIEHQGCKVYRCSSILDLIRARLCGARISILSLHAGVATIIFQQAIQIVHGFPMKPTHRTHQVIVINSLIKVAKYFGAKTVSVSDFTTVICKRIFGIDIDATIHNGVSELFYSQPFNNNKSKLVLFAGRLDKIKNPIQVALAFLESELPSRGYTLAVIGDGAEMEKLRRIAEQNKSISILGEISELEKVTLFRSAEIFISLHDLEPMGVVFAEAMVSKCKVVCPSSGGQLGFFPTFYPFYLASAENKRSVSDALNAASDCQIKITFDFPQYRYDNIAKEYLRLIYC
jgi:glycosyltransferase involved in cell wall biosynthesis